MNTSEQNRIIIKVGGSEHFDYYSKPTPLVVERMLCYEERIKFNYIGSDDVKTVIKFYRRYRDFYLIMLAYIGILNDFINGLGKCKLLFYEQRVNGYQYIEDRYGVRNVIIHFIPTITYIPLPEESKGYPLLFRLSAYPNLGKFNLPELTLDIQIGCVMIGRGKSEVIDLDEQMKKTIRVQELINSAKHEPIRFFSRKPVISITKYFDINEFLNSDWYKYFQGLFSLNTKARLL